MTSDGRAEADGAVRGPMPGPVVVAGGGPLAAELAALLAGGGAPVTLVSTATADRATRVQHSAELAPAAAGAAVAVEVAVWPFERKRALVEALDTALPSQAVLATLCTAQSTSEIASWTADPARVVGFSLLPPVESATLVEIAPGLNSAPAAVEVVEALFAAVGRESARVRDDAGLVFGRILSLIVNEAAAMLMEGVASARDIDTAMKLGANYPRGPLEWADLVGLDTVYGVLCGLAAEQGEDRYRVCPLLRKMVMAGWLGRQSGRGFFEYPAP